MMLIKATITGMLPLTSIVVVKQRARDIRGHCHGIWIPHKARQLVVGCRRVESSASALGSQMLVM